MAKDTSKLSPEEFPSAITEEEVEYKQRLRELEMVNEEREMAFMEEERELLVWKAPARPYKKRNKDYYTTIGAIVILLSIILFFAQEFLVIAVMLAFAFLAYVLASVEPETIENRVTTRGIRTNGAFYSWGELGRYWFHDKFGQKMMSVETFLTFPRNVVIMLGKTDEEELRKIMSRFVVYDKPEPGFLDKASEWLSKKVPLED